MEYWSDGWGLRSYTTRFFPIYFAYFAFSAAKP